MKKMMRYLGVMVSIVMAIGVLSGCGTAKEELTPTEAPAEILDGIGDEEFLPADLQDDSESPVTEFVPSGIEVSDAEMGETQPVTDNWEEDPSVIPEDQGPQPMGTDELEGKIIVLVWCHGKDAAHIFDIYAVDPQNGKATLVRSFMADRPRQEYEYDLMRPAGNFNFTEDYTKLAHTQEISSNGSFHAGWLDCAGEFTDVNVLVGDGPVGDFDEARNYRAIGFTNTGRFVYQNIDTGEYFSIDPATCSDLQSYAMDFDDFTPIKQSFQDLGFENKSRLVWSRFPSPDGSQLAFMSMQNVQGGTADLYIMPALGGEPTKLETNLPMYGTIYCDVVGDIYGRVPANPEVIVFPYIMDWR